MIRLGQITSGFSSGVRLAQGGHVNKIFIKRLLQDFHKQIGSPTYKYINCNFQIKIVTASDLPVQIDGEPQMQPAGTITILKSALKVSSNEPGLVVGRLTVSSTFKVYVPRFKLKIRNCPSTVIIGNHVKETQIQAPLHRSPSSQTTHGY